MPDPLPTPSLMPRLYDTFLGHARGCVALAEEAAAGLSGPDQAALLQEMDLDYECLLAALRWLQAQPDGGALGNRLALALCPFWEIRGRWTEARQWLETMSEKEVDDESLSAQALNEAGIFSRMQSDWESAARFFQRALHIHQQRADLKGQGIALNGLGAVALIRGEQAAARKFFEEALTVYSRRDAPADIAKGLGNLALVYFNDADYATAERLQQESLAVRRKIGDPREIADALSNLGNTHFVRGNYQEAKLCYQESLSLKVALDYQPGLVDGYVNLASLSAKIGEYDLAYESLRSSLEINETVGDMEAFACAFEILADMGIRQCLPEQAVFWYAAAAALRRKHQIPLRLADLIEIEAALGAVRASLAPKVFKGAWRKGQDLSPDRAISCLAKQHGRFQPLRSQR